MKMKFKLPIYACFVCLLLYWMSGAPFARGWSLFLAGAFTTIACLATLAIGHGMDKQDRNHK
jgi:hypothetical protein